MVFVKIKKRQLPLYFNLVAMRELQELRGGKGLKAEELQEELKDPQVLVDVLLILARQGLQAADSAERVTREELERSITPGMMAKLLVGIFDAITEGLRMESEDDEPTGPVDETLEMLKKKEAEA